MKALVLCAGYGTRLGAITKEIPKPLLPVCGEPLLGYTLRYLSYYGFREVAINLHYKPNLIKEFCGEGSAFGVKITYSIEESPLGTAGAIKRLEDYFSDVEDFLVLYGDLLIDQDLHALMEFHKKRGAAATILVHERERSNSLLYMDSEQRIIGFLERPRIWPRNCPETHWVNSGVQVINRELLKNIPDNEFADLPRDVYVPLLRQVPMFGLPLSGYRCAIDSPQRYREANEAVATGKYTKVWERRIIWGAVS